MVQELEMRFEEQARGVKLIPSWGSYYPHSPEMWPVYKKMEELGMVLLSHSGGVDALFEVEGEDYAFPANWSPVLEDFPGLNIVLAHLGYVWPYGPEPLEQQMQLAKKYSNVHFDISCAFEEGYTKTNEDFIREVGVDKVMWASDWHAHRAAMGLQSLKRSGLSEEEKRKILSENARCLIKL
jgi:predicted TIM-barrel fold metal-dependent hydrolase